MVSPSDTKAPNTPAAPTSSISTDSDWWRSAVTYQVYIRSFADSNGDGIGDVNGIRSRLGHLVSLGVDAIWINPWYPSPQVDGGYDVSDYREIEPILGTLTDAQSLIDEAHALGLRVLADIVPNHTSDRHLWFQAALESCPGSPERARYIFRPGRGTDGALPPNDWLSVFGGPAWERVTEADGTPGEWYLHLFDVTQPDLNWTNPDVRAEFVDILSFWFDRGVDGFRIDVAHGLLKDPALPDLGADQDAPLVPTTLIDHPYWDQPGVHEIYREWRDVADSYDPPRIFVAEAWVPSPERAAAYLRPGQLHTAFDFDMVRAPWIASDLRATITSSLACHARVGAPVMWVLSNHDITRHVTRHGRSQTQRGLDPLHEVGLHHSDLAIGTRRARAAILLELALPGGVYLYQGEELGLPEVEDLPDAVLADPVWMRSGHTDRGRDGCRVPIPWTQHGPSFGFGPHAPWLPQPVNWGRLSCQAQEADRASMLWLYRDALRIRRVLEFGANGDEASGPLEWLELGDDVVAFRRRQRFICVVNTGSAPVALPAGTILISSLPTPLAGALPTDAAIWLSTD
jgi:alpha-glucosidase